MIYLINTEQGLKTAAKLAVEGDTLLIFMDNELSKNSLLELCKREELIIKLVDDKVRLSYEAYDIRRDKNLVHLNMWMKYVTIKEASQTILNNVSSVISLL